MRMQDVVSVSGAMSDGDVLIVVSSLVYDVQWQVVGPVQRTTSTSFTQDPYTLYLSKSTLEREYPGTGTGNHNKIYRFSITVPYV